MAADKDLDRVDRCTSCHLGISDAERKGAPQPFRTHPGRWLETHRPDRYGCTACHGMSIGKKAVIQAAHVMASTGLDLITEPEFLQAAKAEFAKRTGGKKYVSLNVEPAPPGGLLNDAQKKSFDCVIHTVIEHFGINKDVS